MPTLVLVRHGQSAWNLENRFTGWWDVDLSAAGEEEARQAGRLLADEGLLPDVAHTSLLTRAIRTLNILQEETGRLWIPVYRHWRLNERHYGGLTGLDKAETRDRYGDEQFRLWRRSYDVPPPPMERGGPYDVSLDPRYVPGVVPRYRVPGGRRRPDGAVLVRRHRAPPSGGQGGAWWPLMATACGRSSSTSTR